MNTKTNSFRKAMRPRDIANTVGEYLKEGNLEAIVSLFHIDCVVCFPPTESPRKGLDEVRELWAPFMEIRPTLISKVSHELIHGDTALLQADWRLETDDGSIISEGSSTEVAKQLEDGSWVYYMDCPMGPPNIVM